MEKVLETADLLFIWGRLLGLVDSGLAVRSLQLPYSGSKKKTT